METPRDRSAWLALVLVLVGLAVVVLLVVTRGEHVLVELRGWDEGAVLEHFGPPDRELELSLADAGPEARAVAINAMRRDPSLRVRELCWDKLVRTTCVWLTQEGEVWTVLQGHEHGRWPEL